MLILCLLIICTIGLFIAITRPKEPWTITLDKLKPSCPYCNRPPHWADEICKYDVYDMSKDCIIQTDKEVKYITGPNGKLMTIEEYRRCKPKELL